MWTSDTYRNEVSILGLVASDAAYKVNGFGPGSLLQSFPDSKPADEYPFPATLLSRIGEGGGEPSSPISYQLTNFTGTDGREIRGVEFNNWREVGEAIEVPGTGVAAIIYGRNYSENGQAKSEYIVAFRGTDGRNGQDWFANIQLGKNQWRSIFDTLFGAEGRIASLTNPDGSMARINFTGQSLGGGIAQYAAYEYVRQRETANTALFDPAFEAKRGSLVTLTTFNAFEGGLGLTQLYEGQESELFNPLRLAGVPTAHYSIENDIVHNLGASFDGDSLSQGFLNAVDGGQSNLYNFSTWRHWDAPAPEVAGTERTGNQSYLGLVEGHRIEDGFYQGLQRYNTTFTSAVQGGDSTGPVKIDSLQAVGEIFARFLASEQSGEFASWARVTSAVAMGSLFASVGDIARLLRLVGNSLYKSGDINSLTRAVVASDIGSYFSAFSVKLLAKPAIAVAGASSLVAAIADLFNRGASSQQSTLLINNNISNDKQFRPVPISSINDGTKNGASDSARRFALLLGVLQTDIVVGTPIERDRNTVNAIVGDPIEFTKTLYGSADGYSSSLAQLTNQAKTLDFAGDNLKTIDFASDLRAFSSAEAERIGGDDNALRAYLDAQVVDYIRDLTTAVINAAPEDLQSGLRGSSPIVLTNVDSNVAYREIVNRLQDDFNNFDLSALFGLSDSSAASLNAELKQSRANLLLAADATALRAEAAGFNDFNSQSFDPEAAAVSVSLAEGGAAPFLAETAYEAPEGGTRIRYQVVGASNDTVEVVTGAESIQLDSSGTFDIVIPEGQRQMSFALVQNKNISADSTLTLSATLLDSSGNPTHQTQTVGTIALASVDEGTDTPETTYSIFGDQAPGSPEQHDAYGNIINGVPTPGRNDFLNGSPDNDRIEGLGGDDAANGGAGDDYILGGDGNDALSGQDGNDRIEGGTGRDFVLGGIGNDLILGQDGTDSLLAGNEGDDRIYGGDQTDEAAVFASDTTNALPGEAEWMDGGDGKDRLIGTAFDNVMMGGAGEDMLAAGAGNDFLYGDRDVAIDPPPPITLGTSVTLSVGEINLAGGADVLFGGGGDDTIEGDVGADALFGNGGDDTMFGDANDLADQYGGGDFLDGGEGNDNLHGQQGNDALYGGAGDDTLQGDDPGQAQGDDYLAGEDGNDVLIGAGGNDVLSGGSGNDELHGDGENVALDQQGKDELYGGDGDDSMNGYGGDDLVDGGAGIDTMFGGLGKDRLLGGTGNDTLTGDEGSGNPDGGEADLMDGGEGDDFLFGQGGDDQMFGGAGKDWLQAGVGDDQLFGSSDDDNLFGEAGADRVDGDDGDDELHGGDGVDVVLGGAGDDKLFGEDGADTLNGNTGNDRIQAGSGDDTASGDQGNDLMFGEDGNDLISGDQGDDELQGNAGDDHLDGGDGNDTLFGQDGSDVLLGGSGDDYLEGGGGQDQLVGGDGFDVYAYNRSDGRDTIVDSGDNAIAFGAGITLADIALSIGSLDLALGNGDEIHIEGFDPEDPFNTSSITEFRFDDGTVASLQQLLALGFNLEGTPDTDSIIGTPLDDRIHAFEGDDTVIAKAGNDMVDAGTGDDIVDAGEGDDTVLAGDGNDVVYGGKGNDELNGDFGDDQLYGEKGIDTLFGGDGNDLLDGGIDGDFLHGGAGDDQLYGGKGSDTLDGGEGADLLTGGTGGDLYVVDQLDTVLEDPGEGVDTVSAAFSYALGDNLENLTLAAGAGAIDGTGNALDNRITGNESDNQLFGLEGDDVLVGNDGNDFLDGGAGADLFLGGLGDDTYVLDDVGDVIREAPDVHTVTVDLGTGEEIRTDIFGGVDSVIASNDYALDYDLENLTLVGSARFGRGNIESNVIVGNDAGDLLTAYTLNHASDNRPGVLVGFVEPGDGAQERLNDRAAQALYKGELTTQDFNSIGTVIDLGPREGDALIGGAGDDTLLGDLDDDYLEGGEGNDLLFGFGGADTLVGGAGDDTYVVDEGYSYFEGFSNGPSLSYEDGSSDELIENADEGTDTVLSRVDYTLGDNFENLTLISDTSAYEQDLGVYGRAAPNGDFHFATIGQGNALDNVITGNDFGDELYGEEGNDALIGGAASDFLDGGVGDDSMAGGAGDDVYEVDSLADQVTEASDQGTDLVETWLEDYTLGENVENLNLLSDADSVGTGNELDNVITGGSGNDTLRALAGNDTLDGGFGDDQMAGGTGDDTYFVDSEFDSVLEAPDEGYDSVFSAVSYQLGDNVEALYLTGSNGDFGAGNDLDNLIVGDDSWNELDGAGGDDVMDGGDGNDALYGDAGNDVLDGGFGDDYMEGGAGDDTYRVDSFSDQVVESFDEGTDTVEEDLSFYTLGANVENATVTGSFATDGGFPYDAWSVQGNELDNRILGNDAQNFVDGGDGNDTVDGFAFDDTLQGDAGNDVLYGGDDVVMRGSDIDPSGEGGVDPLAQVIAPNADALYGGDGDDELDGGSGNDMLQGDDGNDSLYGGDDGAEVTLEQFIDGEGGVEFGGINGVLFIGDGFFIDNTQGFLTNDDFLDGGAGDDVLDGGSGNDQLHGGEGNDELYGGEDGPLNRSNNDYLDGGAGTDFMVGGSGDDTYVVDGVFTETTDIPVYDLCGDVIPGEVTRLWTTDTVFEQAGEGYDVVRASADFTLADNVEELQLGWFSAAVLGRGNAGDNLIRGNNNDNRLEGGAGDDQLFGDVGNDILEGGDGNDFLEGGAGDDIYLFGASSGRDVVSSFGGGIDVVHVDAALDASGLVLSRNGDDVTIAVPGTGARMTLSNWFAQPGVQEIDFCDDTFWDAQAIADLANAHLVDAQDDFDFVQEDGATVASGNVLDDDSGSTGALTVTNPGIYTGQYGTLSLSADGSYSYALDNAAVQWLAEGESLSDSFVYDMQDEAGAGDSASLDFDIFGTNDDPVVTPAPGGDGATLTEDALVFEPDGEGVANGSLETGDFEGWSVSGDPSSYEMLQFFAADGLYSAGFFAFGAPNVLSQDIETVAGQHYRLSFWLQGGASDGAEADVYWDGALVSSQTNVFLNDFTQFQYDVVAATDLSQLEFSLQNDSDEWLLDAVSVRGPFLSASDTEEASGTLSFTDIDRDDAHWTFVDQQDYMGFFDARLVADSTGGFTGRVDWTFSADNADIQYLAEGEVLEQDYDVSVYDGFGAGTTQTVSIRLVGTNDAPLIDYAGDASEFIEDDTPADGTIDFSDVDLADVHTVTVAPAQSGYLGALQAVVTLDSTDEGSGSVDWAFTADSAALDFLAEGEILLQDYSITIDDGHPGGTATQSVEITIVGTNDDPVLQAGEGAVAEDATLSEIVAGANLLANGGFETGDFSGWTLAGNVDFTDVDDVTPASGGFAADFGAIGAEGSLTQAVATTGGQQYVLDFRLRGGGTEGADFTVSWNGEMLDTLANQILDDYTDFEFLLSGADGSSSLAFAFRNDPELWQLDDVSLRALQPQDVLPAVQVASGTLAFSDVDLADAHEVFVDPQDAGYLGSLDVVIAQDSTGSGTGALAWTFSVDNAALQYLAEGETLTQSYDVIVDDGNADPAQTLTVTLAGVNDAPVVTAADVAGSVVEDASSGGLESTGGGIDFSDVDLTDAHAATAHALGTGYLGTFDAQLADDSTGGATGTIDWAFSIDDGAIQYLAEGETLVQSYAVTIDDGHAGGRATQLVSVSLVGTNDAPVAFEDVASVSEDGPLAASGNVLANDTDPDHGTVLAVANPGTHAGAYGTLVLAADGSYTYTLDDAAVQSLGAGSSVSDAFAYTASDGALDASSVLTVTIAGANDTPAAGDDAADVQEDSVLSASGNVLTNDADVDGGTTLQVQSPGFYTGTYGTLALAADGSYTYALDNASVGVQALAQGHSVSDTFSYAATDGLASTPASLTVTIAGSNDAPIAFDDAAAVQEDGPLVASGNVLANDSDVDNGTVLAVASPGAFAGSYGSLTLAADGAYTYTVDNAAAAVQALREGQAVLERFDYAATDGIATATASLTITVAGANDAPAAAGDSGSLQEDLVLAASGNVLANDSDPDAGTMLAAVLMGSSAGAYGTLSLASDGSYTYALDNASAAVQALRAGQHVSDVFSYSATDGIVATAGTLSIDVAGANDAPVLANPIPDQVADAGSPFSFTFAANTFADIDQGDVLSYSASLADGSALPSWLAFDAAMRTFAGTPPGTSGGGSDCGCGDGTGSATTLELRVTAADQSNALASDAFTLNVNGGSGGGSTTGQLIVGTPGNDILTGTACDDVIDGREGGDTMKGGKGNDTYFVDQSCSDGGHGNEGVGNGEDPPPPGHDYNQNDGPGTGPGNPGRSQDGHGGSDCGTPACVADLVVENANEGYDVVYASVDYTLPANVEEVHLLGCDDLDAAGNGLANLLEGNSGDNVLSGGAGADTYVYSLHGGDDVIDEKGAAGQVDTLKLQGVDAATVRLSKSGNNLVVDFPGRDGKVTIKNWFSSSASRVEHFQFDDGSVWDEAKIRSQVGKKVAPVQDSPSSSQDGHHGSDSDAYRSSQNGRDEDGRNQNRDEEKCRTDTDEAILRRLKAPVSFSFDEVMRALGDTGETLSAAEIARRWASARNYFCDTGDCQDPHAGDAFPSLKDLGLSLPAQGCGFGFEGSVGEHGRCGDMKGFCGLSEGFRRL